MSKIYVDEIAGIASADTVAIPGHIIQVKEMSVSADVLTTSLSFVDSSHTISITPSSTASRIIVMFDAPIRLSGIARARGGIRFQRDGTSLFTGYIEERQLHSSSAGSATEFTNPTSRIYIDSPSTTSSVTYTVQHCVAASSNTSRIYGTATGAVSSLIVMEIAG
jgi:hypothetical protein